MSYCPECGEKIANDDVFCPFCGISLKPISPVDDSSMSETIVGMPPPSALENTAASTAKTETQRAKIEPQNEPVAAKQEEAQPISQPVSTPNFTPGDTSENWAMKTESVEIPAEQLEDIKSLPLPSPFGSDEPAPAKEESSPFIESAPPSPLTTEEPVISTPVETPQKPENLADVPTPSLIQEQDLTPKAEEPVDETPVFTNPFSEPVSSFEERTETPPFAETAEPVEEKIDEFDKIPTEIPSDFAESNLSAEMSPPVAEESPVADETKPVSEELPETPTEMESSPFEKTLEEVIVQPVEETNEPAIEMPELPLSSENQNQDARFDSVQIIQTDEIEEEQAKAAKAESKSVEETPISEAPVLETPRELKEEQSSTTPNFTNSDTDGRKAAKLKPLDEGTILNNRYEIVRKIGGGGMGAVYLANDRNLGGVLRAVKEMVQSYIESEQQEKAINDFKRESLLLTSLDHQSIPTIYDYFLDEKEGRFYLVMKYISGGDLASRLRAAPEGRLDEKTVTEWAIQIADVLDYLHNHEPSIVYRDLKPANVMIDGNSGRVMLIDFGIARWVNKEEKGVTAVGTMGYAPPELFSGNVEPRSDIYSLGSTMFHLLTGADPQSNPLLIFDFQKNPRPRQINSQLSDQIEQILLRAVEYNAEARFSSAAEMRDALKEHFNNVILGKVTYGVKVAPSNRAFSEQAVFCGFCGKQIVATDVFCAFCGAQQPIAQQSISHPSIAVQPLTAKLVIQGTGELEPSSFRLEKSDNLLGRRDPMSNIFPEVDLSKYDPQTKISRRHARIWREGNSFLVEDLGSSNGTTLLPSSSDSVRLLPHQPHTLTNGDKIKLGDTTLHFTIG